MDITLGMLLDPLQDCTWNIQREEQLEQICRGVELLPRDGGELKEDVVYLTDSYRSETVYEVYQACPFREKLCLLYICAPGEEPVSVCSVSIETPRELSVILNQLVGKFFQYMNWERDLDTCILKNASMEQLLDTAASMIGDPIQIYDPSLKLIASSSMESDDMLYQEIRENHGLNRKTAEYLSEINFFPPDDVHPSPILLYEDSPISPYVQLFYRVDVAGRIKAIVYVVFSGKAYSPIAVRLMHLLVEKVGIAVEQNDILDSYNSLSYSYLIQDLLSEKKISPEEIESRAAMVSLPYQASFYVLSFPTAGYQASPPLEFFLWECESILPNVRTLCTDETVIILLYFSEDGEAAEKQFRNYLGQLEPLMKKHGLTAGHSRRFTQLSDLKVYFEQACQARFLGERMLDSGFVREFDLKLPHPKSCFFDYDEYTLVHMVASFCERVPYRSFCRPELLELVEFARMVKTNHVAVLFAYLICSCRLTDTADYLHMHRNNIVYHIRRIEEMMNLSLKELAVRNELLASYMALCLSE